MPPIPQRPAFRSKWTSSKESKPSIHEDWLFWKLSALTSPTLLFTGSGTLSTVLVMVLVLLVSLAAALIAATGCPGLLMTSRYVAGR
ncbi:hypothetical protein HYQ46_010535 [Verticillium longisporum]|nr:hypothetical protein HYQ46_010535 [Verticillium longisporum]